MRTRCVVLAASAAFLVGAASASAQNTANYTFTTATNASLTDMSSGTTQLLGANVDDTASPLANIGFDFYVQGTRFTQFSINENGVLRLGATAQASTPYKPLAQAGITIITAYGGDQRTHLGDGKVHFKVIGSAPSRTLVVEWLNNQANFNTGGTADLTYQVRLYETTGVIELVYGSMTMSTLGAADVNSQSPNIGFSSSNTSSSVGSITAAQSGTPAPSYNGASATPVANLYTAGAITVLTGAVDGSRRIFTLTPPAPTAPTNLTFTSITPIGMTLNWTDSPNEVSYAIYSSTDGGTTYNFVAAAAQNATSQAVSGLAPNTSYMWRVNAVSEGTLAALSGTQGTPPPTPNSSLGSGLWSAPGTWSTGVVPTAFDAVTIAATHTVTIDTAAVAFSVTVANMGVLQYEAATARTLTTSGDVTVQSGGLLQSNPTGTVTAHSLSTSGNIIVNGTLDFSTNVNTAGAGLVVTGTPNTSLSGTGSVNIRALQVNKGATQSSVFELMPTNFTVQGSTTDTAASAFLTLTNGTLKVSGTFTGTHRTFLTAAYNILAVQGLWLNNPNYTVAGQNGAAILTGLLRITSGTFNVGTAANNALGFAVGSTIIVEGGAVNASGRFGVGAAANAISYTQSGGTITVDTVGNTSTTLASFDLGTGVGGTISMTGGTIVNQLASTAVSGPRDYRNQAGTTGITTVTGGTLQLGNAASGAAKTFNIAGVVANLVVTSTSAGHSVNFLTPVAFNNISRNIAIQAGATLNIGNLVFLFNGDTLTNDGTFTANGANSNFVTFLTTAPQTVAGSGVFTAPITNFAIQSDSGLVLTPTNQITAGAIRLFSGSVTNANKFTLGSGGATTGVVQIGNTTTPTNAGTFDTGFTFNLGTGGETVSYLRTSNTRTTGPEINPARTLTSMTYDDNDITHSLTIAGGDLTLSSAAAALALTNGHVVTGANTLILSSGTATVTRTTGLVDGNFRKTFAAAANKTFEVGSANGFSPVAVNVTAATTFPVTFTVAAIQTPAPGIAPVSTSLQRYWQLTSGAASPDLTADLTFNYLDADVPGTANEAAFVLYRKDPPNVFTDMSGTVNTGANTASVTGVTQFSPWTLGEPGATPVELLSIEIN